MKTIFTIMLTSLLGMLIVSNYANAYSNNKKETGKTSTQKKDMGKTSAKKKAKPEKKKKKMTKEEALKLENKDKGLY